MCRTLLLLACFHLALAQGNADEIQFNRDIRPILSDNCFLCHGPADSTREADFRLDEREAAIDSGNLVPGASNESELVARLFSDDPDELMPPPHSHKKLSVEQKQLLSQWIAEGAIYEQHWSFATPRNAYHPVEPAAVANPIDHFVQQQLTSNGLRLSKPASPRTLIRRVTFDLTGLPPTLSEVDKFLQRVDTRGIDAAYEHLVDRLLASSSYGERMAQAWLDAARYGDTSVMHADGPRDMWPWRDWVINAYNSNMPFDQFTTEQLAGDLLPNATPQQKVASGFNRNHATSDEGGAFPEELRVEYVVDRVQTTSTVWLGLTMECAQCHDHKYDPISQKEYYEFFAYFNNTSDPGMQTRSGNQAPTVEVVNDQTIAKLARLRSEISSRQKEITDFRAANEQLFVDWLEKVAAEHGDNPAVPEIQGLSLWFPIDHDGSEVLQDAAGSGAAKLEKGKLETADRNGNPALKLDGRTQFSCDASPELEYNQPFTLAAWIKYDGNSGGAVFSKLDVGSAYRGYDLWIQNGQIGTHIVSEWPNNAIKTVSKNKLKKNQWQHVVVAYNGNQKATGVKIYIDGRLSKNHVEADAVNGSIRTKVPFRIGSRSTGANWSGEVDDIRIYDHALDANEVSLAKVDNLQAIIAIPNEQRSEQQTELLRNHYFATQISTYQDLAKKLADLRQTKSKLEGESTTSMIMSDNAADKMRMTYVLNRGQYDSPDKKRPVEPNVPAALPSLPKSASANRLGLAQWLVQSDHPLTARVAVNRYWMMLFGQGLVRTAGDFGAQGSPPTHPELLDWLAIDFVESEWNVKRMLKQMVMSKTYCQSSVQTSTKRRTDPANILLSRSPRFRLPGEFIRDQALAVSGLLVHQVGGPGVKPYQPANIWNEVSINSGLRYKRDDGKKLYRKSLYTYWKRSAPMPNMTIFDVPSREKCVVQRSRTNTPLQALVTLNDPQFVESARGFAERLINDAATTSERIDLAYQIATARHATDHEISVVEKILNDQREHFSNDHEKAAKFLSVGESERDGTIGVVEHAAWTAVAQVILNLDETLTRN